jgi:type IV pilus assembly protein PilV
MTLIEVLVTLVLISVGLLGVAALQLTSLRSNQEAYVRSQASVLAGDILDRMRANQAGVHNGDYAANGGPAIPHGTGTAGTAAAQDLTTWNAAIDAALPGNPSGSILLTGCPPAPPIPRCVVTITIGWGERAQAATGLLAQFVTFTTRTEI